MDEDYGWVDLYRAEEDMQSGPSLDGGDNQQSGGADSGQQGAQLRNFLAHLGLTHLYEDKLSLKTVLQIDKMNVSEEPPKSITDLPWYFLKKLMSVNVTARNAKCKGSPHEAAPESAELDLSHLLDDLNLDNQPNPLDIVTALFFCSDHFVRQEMALKMSLCQFAVPLLLPSVDSKQCTLLLWAMRDIVIKYRPQSLSESKGFIEERTVLSQLPLLAFVRLGDCSISKSEVLNKILSNSQQYHDIFVHHNMECGNSPRKISSGMVEMIWYLPCGSKNMDHFKVPVSVANLRGDVESFDTQYSFLCQISTALFVFCDDLVLACRMLTKQHHRAQIFLVSNSQSRSFNVAALKQVASKLELKNNNIILRKQQKNEADFVKRLRDKINDLVDDPNVGEMSIEGMAGVAHDLGILVDEDLPECQRAKKNADAITAEIKDPLTYKETHLPRQGEIWKKLTEVEKEQFRLRKAGNLNIEMYKSDLEIRKKDLRNQQQSYEMSSSMAAFIHAISTPGMERSFFLKWMRMNLDNLSRETMSKLREQYKVKCDSSKDKQEIQKIDRQLSSSSLGIEHFLREMGQIYEASLSTGDSNRFHQQLQHLPTLCAQLLLDGFPLELVDGDASNTPLTWMRSVLQQLHALINPEVKIKVITVLGVQSTGKSTLLNTMFGVSSGRCTRGAFMLLIKVGDDIKNILNCDYVVIIDTEGLKSPQLAHLDGSYDHDNELATLVVGLSDITIINISMEHMQEMEDVLQIVVHAFLRMKEVGKKPKCLFVHQNVSDVSAHDTNMRDRKVLLQKLNRMTQEAAKMEKREENKLFTDVMEYNPDTGNWYIPGLWNGTPPMAPVNLGYSEAVHDLKIKTIQKLRDCNSSDNNILTFTEWLSSLWSAVKLENFIFSFRNSLVADAYIKLCTEFNKWEWEFKKAIYTWSSKAETRISNFVAGSPEIADLETLIHSLKVEAAQELSRWEKKLLDNLKQYFDEADSSAHLIERYREQFANSAKSLRREIESSVHIQLTRAAEIKQGMTELDRIKRKHIDELEGRVRDLIDQCRKTKTKMSDAQLMKEFDRMWSETVNKLSFSKQKTSNVYASVYKHLWDNLCHKGAFASELLSEKNLQECGLKPFKFNPSSFTRVTDWLKKKFKKESHIKAVQNMADNIITTCTQFAQDKVDRKSNYHDTYIQEILHKIDDQLRANQKLETGIEFEVSLKQHICGVVARKFQKMHEDFIQLNDPYRCLAKNKEKFFTDFKDVFHEQDQCQSKADEFAHKCLKPAIEDFVNRFLGVHIVDEMLTQEQFKTEMSFQYTILLELLSRMDFPEYQVYIGSYDRYSKYCIHEQIISHFSASTAMEKFEDSLICSSIKSIKEAIEQAKERKRGSLKEFIQDIYAQLNDKLVMAQTALGEFMIFNNADEEQFAHWLTKSLEDVSKAVREEFKKLGIETRLKRLTVNPQDELFTKVIGCGEQCPFCTAPCEAGGHAHTMHKASLHRPIGLGEHTFHDSKRLVTDICSSQVISKARFRSRATKGQWHPYKTYSEIYPNWEIVPDVSLQASDYWKYVMVKFNENFARVYESKPAVIPESWKRITQKQAEDSLKKSFNVIEDKTHNDLTKHKMK
ncbi:up-regulator of cell proliferation-like isoform X2 [Synchiropus splendidus]|uniref:up-regulator of cell proliferation-like isoform X2 n=1 Tax=Synchiropus splendidus TaxID=270530 RepID=UPI00237DB4CC|nr:up-regulator of cell proliferation-like isoform X2 [Synchiropus splendidus]